jgi:hypothetical protein
MRSFAIFAAASAASAASLIVVVVVVVVVAIGRKNVAAATFKFLNPLCTRPRFSLPW